MNQEFNEKQVTSIICGIIYYFKPIEMDIPRELNNRKVTSMRPDKVILRDIPQLSMSQIN